MASLPIAESDYADDAAPPLDGEDVWECALQQFDSVSLPQQVIRAEALQARRFVTVSGAMWEGFWGDQFENAPRPEVDKITPGLEKIETDYRENRLMVSFIPANDAADEETAETLEGMYRADANEFKSQQAEDNAFAEAIRGGFGAWRMTTDYSDPYDPDDDSQRINPGVMIPDADQSVFFDGNAVLYDKSDAKWAFIISAKSRAVAEAEWGEENCSPWPTSIWKYAYDWYTPDVVRIAEYYKVEEDSDTLLILTNDLTKEEQRYFKAEIDPGALTDLIAQGWKKRTRPIKRRRVHKYILNGTKVLKDCGYIAGDQIPIIPVYYRRDWTDNLERFRGYVAKKMDRQRIYNAGISKVVETQALAPYEVPILFAEQLAGYITGADGSQMAIAEHWARGNIDRTPFRVIMPVYDGDGKLVPTGPIGKIEAPQVQPATAALLQISSSDLSDDDQNVEEVKANTSADAMDVATARVDAKSGIALDYMRQSYQRAGEIYKGIARDIYFEPGRKVDTRTADGDESQATLGETVIDAQNVYRIRNDLTKGKYKVVASVQESTTTARQKTVRQGLQIVEVLAPMQTMQDIAAAAALTVIMNLDGEGIDNLQKIARKKGIEIGLVDPTPEEAQQIKQAASQPQQPSPADQALGAQAQKLASEAQLNQAKAVTEMADANLKHAQATVLGGPDKVPDTPTGLSAVKDAADIHDTIAGADLKQAQAAHLNQSIEEKRQAMGDKHIQMGHDMNMDHKAHDLAAQEAQNGQAQQ